MRSGHDIRWTVVVDDGCPHRHRLSERARPVPMTWPPPVPRPCDCAAHGDNRLSPQWEPNRPRDSRIRFRAAQPSPPRGRHDSPTPIPEPRAPSPPTSRLMSVRRPRHRGRSPRRSGRCCTRSSAGWRGAADRSGVERRRTVFRDVVERWNCRVGQRLCHALDAIAETIRDNERALREAADRHAQQPSVRRALTA